MNSNQIEIWKQATEEHCHHLKNLIREDKEIKEMFEEHLAMFFEGFVEVEFSEEFHKATMKWDWKDAPIINTGTIGDFGMDWEISKHFSDEHGGGICIIVYPWGR